MATTELLLFVMARGAVSAIVAAVRQWYQERRHSIRCTDHTSNRYSNMSCSRSGIILSISTIDMQALPFSLIKRKPSTLFGQNITQTQIIPLRQCISCHVDRGNFWRFSTLSVYTINRQRRPGLARPLADVHIRRQEIREVSNKFL